VSAAKCWEAWPVGFHPTSDVYLGYVFAVDLTQAKRIATLTDPGENDFCTFRFRRKPSMDGLCEPEVAFWTESDVPSNFPIPASDLWHPS
jgi:hypothetical protein